MTSHTLTDTRGRSPTAHARLLVTVAVIFQQGSKITNAPHRLTFVFVSAVVTVTRLQPFPVNRVGGSPVCGFVEGPFWQCGAKPAGSPWQRCAPVTETKWRHTDLCGFFFCVIAPGESTLFTCLVSLWGGGGGGSRVNRPIAGRWICAFDLFDLPVPRPRPPVTYKTHYKSSFSQQVNTVWERVDGAVLYIYTDAVL